MKYENYQEINLSSIFFSVKGEKNVENFLCNYENKSEHLKITD